MFVIEYDSVGRGRAVRGQYAKETEGMDERQMSTAEVDAAIVELYFARNERAISETHARYGGACMQVSMGILNSRPDAEECVNDTYLETWNSIPPTRPRSLCAYVCRIARNLSISRLRRRLAAKRGGDMTVSLEELAECIPAGEDVRGELPELLSAFLRTLGARERSLFMERYWYARAVKDIAREHGMTATAVSVNLHRTRERLRVYLSERGYTL